MLRAGEPPRETYRRIPGDRLAPGGDWRYSGSASPWGSLWEVDLGKVVPLSRPRHQGSINATRVSQGVFLVMVNVAPGNPGDPNVEIIAAKLRRGDAERVTLQIPGAWIEKVQAEK